MPKTNKLGKSIKKDITPKQGDHLVNDVPQVLWNGFIKSLKKQSSKAKVNVYSGKEAENILKSNEEFSSFYCSFTKLKEKYSAWRNEELTVSKKCSEKSQDKKARGDDNSKAFGEQGKKIQNIIIAMAANNTINSVSEKDSYTCLKKVIGSLLACSIDTECLKRDKLDITDMGEKEKIIRRFNKTVSDYKARHGDYGEEIQSINADFIKGCRSHFTRT